ncbi:site-specific integrase [Pseudidiomarina sp. 1APR75-15]|nr:site-specific integrase [Pseudidiomarina sp. 1APR75-15]
MDRFGKDNSLSGCLYLVLGVRKGELAESPWSEFDLVKGEWEIPDHRVKKGKGIIIPLSTQAVEWLHMLKARSFGSEYVLPARRGSTKPYIGSDTRNRAINKMFGIEKGRKKPGPNYMGDIAHFTVHDLRRTFRSQVSALGFSGVVDERAINHSLKGLEGLYDRYDYYEERRQAHQKVADAIELLVWYDLM